MGLLRHVRPNCPCMVFIGVDGSPFALLVPPQQPKSYRLYQYKSNMQQAEPVGTGFSVSDHIEKSYTNDKPVAALAKFASIESFIGLDLAHFFFTPENISAAERAIDRLVPAKDQKCVIKSVELAGTITRALQGTPCRFVSFVNTIGKVPPILDVIRTLPCRLDYVVTYFTRQCNDTARQLSGSVFVMSTENPGGQGAHIASQKTAYQLVTRCRAHNCAVEWKVLPNQLVDISDQVLFVPVLSNDAHPFALDVSPLPNQKKIAFQLTAKYIINDTDQPKNTAFIFRILNICLETSKSEEEIAKTVNWNNVLWFWLHVICSRAPREGLSAVIRIAANVIANLGEKVPKSFERGVCALAHLWVFSDDSVLRYIGWQVLGQTEINELNIIPKIVENEGKQILLTINGVQEKGTSDGLPSEEARKYQGKLALYLPIRTELKQYLLNIDPEYKQILDKLVKSFM